MALGSVGPQNELRGFAADIQAPSRLLRGWEAYSSRV